MTEDQSYIVDDTFESERLDTAEGKVRQLRAENKRMLDLLKRIYEAEDSGDITLTNDLFCDLYDLLHVKSTTIKEPDDA